MVVGSICPLRFVVWCLVNQRGLVFEGLRDGNFITVLPLTLSLVLPLCSFESAVLTLS